MSQGGPNSSAGSGGAVIETLTGNSGGAVGPDGAFNIDFIGSNVTGIDIVGTPGSNLMTVLGLPSTETQVGTVELATGAETTTGTSTTLAVHPSGLNTKLGTQTANGLIYGQGGAGSNLGALGEATNGQIPIGSTGNPPVLALPTSSDASITVTGGAGTLDFVVASAGTENFVTDAGTATQVAGSINILGSHGLNTTGAGDTVTVLIDNVIVLGDLSAVATGSPSLTLTTGDLDIASGNIELPATSASGDDGVINVDGTRFIHNYGGTNTFIGPNAGTFALSIPTSAENVGIGSNACDALSIATHTIGIGQNACGSVTFSSFNVGIGGGALQTTTGSQNVAVGFAALRDNTSSGNVAIGTNCIAASAGNSGLVAVGSGALISCKGSNNTALGQGVLDLLATGTANIGIGKDAGNALTLTDSDNIIMGNAGVVGDNNTIRIGTQGTGAAQQDTTFIAGIAQVVVANPEAVYVDTSTGQLGSFPSNSLISVTALDDTDSPYTALSTDYYMSCNVSAGALTIDLFDAPSTGRVFIVKDAGGDAVTNNITVTTTGGAVLIDGATTFVLNQTYQAAQFVFNGAAYEVF